jgi:hypothetical protein
MSSHPANSKQHERVRSSLAREPPRVVDPPLHELWTSVEIEAGLAAISSVEGGTGADDCAQSYPSSAERPLQQGLCIMPRTATDAFASSLEGRPGSLES